MYKSLYSMLFRDMNNCTVICLQMLYRNQHFDYLTIQEQTETAKNRVWHNDIIK